MHPPARARIGFFDSLSHIKKENDVFFPMAEKTLDRARLERMSKSFEEHKERAIGRVRHEELHQLLKELRLKYLK